MDCGSNTNCKPINLLQFAQMSSIYIKDALGVESPAIGLLNMMSAATMSATAVSTTAVTSAMSTGAAGTLWTVFFILIHKLCIRILYIDFSKAST